MRTAHAVSESRIVGSAPSNGDSPWALIASYCGSSSARARKLRNLVRGAPPADGNFATLGRHAGSTSAAGLEPSPHNRRTSRSRRLRPLPSWWLHGLGGGGGHVTPARTSGASMHMPVPAAAPHLSQSGRSCCRGCDTAQSSGHRGCGCSGLRVMVGERAARVVRSRQLVGLRARGPWCTLPSISTS